jgi:putative transposase
MIADDGMTFDLSMAEDPMPRSRRNTAPGCVHHVVNRGNRRVTIFRKAGDYRAFIRILAEAISLYRMRMISFTLMRNHWHLVLWPGEDVSISAFMGWLTTTHVRRYHEHYGLTGTGHLYQERYHNDVCWEARDVLSVIRYVEGNPLAAGLVKRAEDWPWSSLAFRLRGQGEGLLSPGPIELPANWPEYVNEATPRRAPDSPRRRPGDTWRRRRL